MVPNPRFPLCECSVLTATGSLLGRMICIISFLLASIAVFFPGTAQAGYITNEDFVSPGAANDFHVVLVSNTPINLDEIVTAPSDMKGVPTKAFPPPGTKHFGPPFPSNILISGDGTDSVVVTFTGATFSTGEWTHIGLSETGSGARISDSYWTLNGSIIASMAGALPGAQSRGTSSSWLVERITLYDSSNNIIGHEWVEDQATSFSLTGSPQSNLFYSTATMISPTFIPLDQLNENLSGFGPESPIGFLPQTPEPSGIVLASLGGLGLLGYGWRRKLAA